MQDQGALLPCLLLLCPEICQSRIWTQRKLFPANSPLHASVCSSSILHLLFCWEGAQNWEMPAISRIEEMMLPLACYAPSCRHTPFQAWRHLSTSELASCQSCPGLGRRTSLSSTDKGPQTWNAVYVHAHALGCQQFGRQGACGALSCSHVELAGTTCSVPIQPSESAGPSQLQLPGQAHLAGPSQPHQVSTNELATVTTPTHAHLAVESHHRTPASFLFLVWLP